MKRLEHIKRRDKHDRVRDIKLRNIVLETEDRNRLILPSSFLLSKSLEIAKNE
jgi:hypothetical protein